jgi:ribosomal protein L37E
MKLYKRCPRCGCARFHIPSGRCSQCGYAKPKPKPKT